ncbi:B-box zinc finger protein 21 [Bienertia sinuspersici]
MKIQCDVCSKIEASVFCLADEAALCDECDQSIHHANKLASKHQRFSLLQTSSSHFPICDICQEKRALIFCQQDRAILCGDCEIPLHSSNEHTKKHNRFLLTGIKLSSTIISDNTKKDDHHIIISNNYEEDYDPVPSFQPTTKPSSDFTEKPADSAVSFVTNNSNDSVISSNNNQLINGGLTSNYISEYLIDMLPGWHFEDLIADNSASNLGFCKNGTTTNNNQHFEDVLSFLDVENDDKELTISSAHQSENFWVPQARIPATTTMGGINNSSNVFGQQNSSGIHHNYTTSGGLIHGIKQQQQETSVTTMKKYLKDDVFTVPQISSFVGSKRNRSFW